MSGRSSIIVISFSNCYGIKYAVAVHCCCSMSRVSLFQNGRDRDEVASSSTSFRLNKPLSVKFHVTFHWLGFYTVERLVMAVTTNQLIRDISWHSSSHVIMSGSLLF